MDDSGSWDWIRCCAANVQENSKVRNISTRFFLAILATLAVVVAVMGLATRWSFERGFIGYLNEQAQTRTVEVLPRVQQAYALHGNWDFLRDDREAWFALMRPSDLVEWRGNDIAIRPPPPDSDLSGAVVRLGLLDAQKQFVAGYRQINEAFPKQAVVVNGNTVGWLVLAPFEEGTADADRRFQRSQTRSLAGVALLALSMAAVLAWGLSRRLTRPVTQLTRATHRLAAGHHDVRVKLDRRDEIGVLADDFNRLAETLERNQTLRKEFLADVSHELRTPLAVLRGEMEALQDGLMPLTCDGIAALQVEVMQLEKLVNDLNDLALSDVGALSYRMERLDLAELARQVATPHQAALQRLGLTLRLDLPEMPVPVHGDAARLRQLIDNLLTNSARYTDAPGRVELSVAASASRAHLAVSDSAPSVPAAELGRLFDRLYRVDTSRNRETGGVGLGLAIARNIVHAHQGEIAARPSPLGGVCVALTLPAAT
jgi:two-component system sensor histidine kinase BaeS